MKTNAHGRGEREEGGLRPLTVTRTLRGDLQSHLISNVLDCSRLSDHACRIDFDIRKSALRVLMEIIQTFAMVSHDNQVMWTGGYCLGTATR